MKIKGEYVLTELGDEFVVVPVGENEQTSRFILRLNETGALIWRGLGDGKSVDEIAKQILEEYDGVDCAGAEKAVLKIIEALRENGIVEE